MNFKVVKIIKSLVLRFKADGISDLAGQLAFKLILSFFPFIILLMTILGYTAIRNTNLLIILQTVLPYSSYNLLYSTVIDIVEHKDSALLPITILFTIWSASSGFRAVITGLNKAYDQEELRPFWKIVVISLISIIALSLIIISSFVFIIFGAHIGTIIKNHLYFSSDFKFIWNIIRYIFIGCESIFIASAVYYYAPCKRLDVIDVIPGAVFSTIGWTIVSICFSFYIDHFNNYSRLYGRLSAIIVIMLWLYFNSIILLIGGEFNATLAFKKHGIKKETGKSY